MLDNTAVSLDSPESLYMAPELVQGGKASSKSDMWSLGVTLFVLATGRYPFKNHLRVS